jgi:uncharacterized damage-inducible protein DinB
MNVVDHIARLFTYDDWANREVLANLRATPAPPPRPLKFIAHTLAAERLWLERLNQQEQTLRSGPTSASSSAKGRRQNFIDSGGTTWRPAAKKDWSSQ